jgi:SAM-dependent methyltransferase
MDCRTCGNNTRLFLSLGLSPLANSFLKKEQLKDAEPRFPLELYFCDMCKLVQLGHIVPSETLFSNYVYASSTAASFRKHFEDSALQMKQLFNLNEKSLAIDIGSNDGILLRGFKKAGIGHLGIEPARNIAKLANDEGLETWNEFFNADTVRKIASKKGKADVITANNVFAHIPDIEQVIKDVKDLLKDSGVFIIEIQYFMDTVGTMTFDNVYHEHMYYYTLISLSNLFSRHKMNIFRVEHVDTHGGSLRVFICKNNRDVHSSVLSYLQSENELGAASFSWYRSFGEKVSDLKEQIVLQVRDLKRSGKIIIGYGAPAKSTTLLNYTGLGKKEIDFIVDDSPLKQGLYAPGTHIEIISSERLKAMSPDIVMVLAWNFAAPIIEKTRQLVSKKTRFFVPLPEPKLV